VYQEQDLVRLSWDRGSARGKALPKKLEQAQLLFSRQLEFSNVGVTHGA